MYPCARAASHPIVTSLTTESLQLLCLLPGALLVPAFSRVSTRKAGEGAWPWVGSEQGRGGEQHGCTCSAGALPSAGEQMLSGVPAGLCSHHSEPASVPSLLDSNLSGEAAPSLFPRKASAEDP